MVFVLVTLFSVSLCPFVFLVVHTGGVEMSYSGMAADITNVHREVTRPRGNVASCIRMPLPAAVSGRVCGLPLFLFV